MFPHPLVTATLCSNISMHTHTHTHTHTERERQTDRQRERERERERVSLLAPTPRTTKQKHWKQQQLTSEPALLLPTMLSSTRTPCPPSRPYNQTKTLITTACSPFWPPFGRATQSVCSGFPASHPTATCLAMKLLTKEHEASVQTDRSNSYYHQGRATQQVDPKIAYPCYKRPHPLGPKYTVILGVSARGCVKPGSAKLAMGHLETVLYKPMCHHGFKVSCARTYPHSRRTYPHSYDMLRNARVNSVYQVEHSCWPSLCHSSPPLLDPVCSTLFSNCHNGTWFYTIFYNTCNAWYMVLRPWVDLIHCSLNQSECLPITPFDWGKLVYSVAN